MEIEGVKQRFQKETQCSIDEVFQLFDKDCKGHISVSEFKETISKLLSQSPQEIDSNLYLLFRRYDQDCDGKLSKQEFSQVLDEFLA